jgi:hypothetical protein
MEGERKRQRGRHILAFHCCEIAPGASPVTRQITTKLEHHTTHRKPIPPIALRSCTEWGRARVIPDGAACLPAAGRAAGGGFRSSRSGGGAMPGRWTWRKSLGRPLVKLMGRGWEEGDCKEPPLLLPPLLAATRLPPASVPARERPACPLRPSALNCPTGGVEPSTGDLSAEGRPGPRCFGGRTWRG